MMEEISAKKTTIEEVVRRDGLYVGPTVGRSMMPMLRERRDSIVVRLKSGRLKPLDVALYRRGKDYVLHRVLSLTDEGYVIRGDNCYSDEYIPEEDVFGVLEEFFRDEKRVPCTDPKYLRYVKRRLKTYKIRRFFVLTKAKVKSAFKKAFKRK